MDGLALGGIIFFKNVHKVRKGTKTSRYVLNSQHKVSVADLQTQDKLFNRNKSLGFIHYGDEIFFTNFHFIDVNYYFKTSCTQGKINISVLCFQQHHLLSYHSLNM